MTNRLIRPTGLHAAPTLLSRNARSTKVLVTTNKGYADRTRLYT